MLPLNTTLIPVVGRALGMVKANTDWQIPGNPSLSEIRKIVLMNTAHKLRTLSMTS